MRLLSTLLFFCLALASTAPADDLPELFGIGVLLSVGGETTGPIIANVVPDSPAHRAKLTPGLILSGVAGRPTTGMALEECVELIRGEPGTPVLIEVTDPRDGRVTRVILFREKLDLGKAPG
jgi:carboxyl-terminal processing protease